MGLVEYIAFIASCLLFGVLVYSFQQFKEIENLKRALESKEENLSIDAFEVLEQLKKGGAVVITQVVDPAQVFAYSPKRSKV